MNKPGNRINQSWWHLLLIAILVTGAYLRFVGINWDSNYHLHPDERFLAMVESSISPVKSVSEYFNTDISSLNPQNRGYSFFVYGTFPIFMVRYLAEAIHQTGYDQVTILGRLASGFFDLGTVCLVYLISLKLFKKIKIGLIASAFYAFAVLPIQLSHFFAVDTFTTFFGMLTYYLATVIQDYRLTTEPYVSVGDEIYSLESEQTGNKRKIPWRFFGLFVLFGICLGMATASKINAIMLAVTLPLASILTRDPEQKNNWRKNFWTVTFPGWVLAAIVALITFRILQPYAFAGTSFLTIKLNPKWLANLTELKNLSSATTGFPPSVQWANRPLWFGWVNMVNWGMGLPLGLLAWLAIAVLIVVKKGKNSSSFWLIALWTLFYFCWQEIQYTVSMRYLLLVYPTLAIIAAFFLDWIWERGKAFLEQQKITWGRIFKITSIVVLAAVVLATIIWGFAFSRIYTRPVTRIDASFWIYQNVPGPINLKIQNGSYTINLPLSYPLGVSIPGSRPVKLVFKANTSGIVSAIDFSFVRDEDLLNPTAIKTFMIELLDLTTGSKVTATLADPFNGSNDPRGNNYTIGFDQPMTITNSQEYQITYSVLEPEEALYVIGAQDLAINFNGTSSKLILPEPTRLIHAGESYDTTFTPVTNGNLLSIDLNRMVDWEQTAGQSIITVSISQTTTSGVEHLGTASISSQFAVTNDVRGDGYAVIFSPSITLAKDQQYSLSVQVTSGNGAIAIYGSRQANESTWDDVLPYNVYGTNPFDYYNGVYRTDLNFEMYWDDNQAKLQRFETTLDQADYIFISSNRQWGSITRLPSYYPLTSAYYRDLIGCPDDKEITWCYSVATPGLFKGSLGFELVKTFQSEPNIGPFAVNTQFAEEAFTVYDHPKVLIFKKTGDYSSQNVQKLLASIDLTNAPSINNYQPSTDSNPATKTLLLPADRLKTQQAGGTWAELFDVNSIINKNQFLGIVVWYLFISLLGWIVFPTIRLVFHGMKDRGYPFGRLVGMLLLALIVWFLGSYQVPFAKTTILICLLGIVLVNAVLAFIYQKDLLSDVQLIKKSIWQAELVSLGFFTLFALIRLGNPDLWHPYKGGEKPMDFSYFNAVLKSTTFPPYDPWYAGGYINYYYYGYVIVGVPVKLLGIIPSIAYNFILPTLFSLTGLGAYCIGWNLTDVLNSRRRKNDDLNSAEEVEKPEKQFPNWAGGIIAAVLLLILGNLGTVRMIWNGFQKLASNGTAVEQGNFFQRWIWTFQGIGKFLTGKAFPYVPGDWYWIPSRAIPGDAITEFPFFTFLYADLHAHMIALPITLGAIGWSLALVLRKWKWNNSNGKLGWLALLVTLITGGIIVGALKPTNTWDIYSYLPFALFALIYGVFKYFNGVKFKNWDLHPTWQKIILAMICCVILFGTASLAYKPFSDWYRQGYNSVEIWKGDRTPFWSYITHWGLFLFLIISWLVYEIRDWMKSTPASALQKLRPYLGIIWAVVFVVVIAIILLLILKVEIAWLVIPLILASAILLFRKDQSDIKRFVLFMIATGLTLTLIVEVIVLKGDIGRMNTVFKLYLQAWSMLSLSAAFGLVDIGSKLFSIEKLGWVSAWKKGLFVLVFGAALFPVLAGMDKIRDRMSTTNSITMNGSRYMLTSTYGENGTTMNLAEDFYAIQYIQQNVQGSPVIVEGNVPEYRWGTRYTIYTGLPSVVGWNWHQRQQRGVVSAEAVQARVDEVGQFYSTQDRTLVEKFLAEYNVKYVIVGQMERAIYPVDGLAKFEQFNGILWHEVYRQDNTVIYQVDGHQ